MPAEYMIVMIFRVCGLCSCQSREVPAKQAKTGLECILDKHAALQAWNRGLYLENWTQKKKSNSEENIENSKDMST